MKEGLVPFNPIVAIVGAPGNIPVPSVGDNVSRFAISGRRDEGGQLDCVRHVPDCIDEVVVRIVFRVSNVQALVRRKRHIVASKFRDNVLEIVWYLSLR